MHGTSSWQRRWRRSLSGRLTCPEGSTRKAGSCSCANSSARASCASAPASRSQVATWPLDGRRAAGQERQVTQLGLDIDLVLCPAGREGDQPVLAISLRPPQDEVVDAGQTSLLTDCSLGGLDG